MNTIQTTQLCNSPVSKEIAISNQNSCADRNAKIKNIAKCIGLGVATGVLFTASLILPPVVLWVSWVAAAAASGPLGLGLVPFLAVFVLSPVIQLGVTAGLMMGTRWCGRKFIVKFRECMETKSENKISAADAKARTRSERAMWITAGVATYFFGGLVVVGAIGACILGAIGGALAFDATSTSIAFKLLLTAPLWIQPILVGINEVAHRCLAKGTPA